MTIKPPSDEGPLFLRNSDNGLRSLIRLPSDDLIDINAGPPLTAVNYTM